MPLGIGEDIFSKFGLHCRNRAGAAEKSVIRSLRQIVANLTDGGKGAPRVKGGIYQNTMALVAIDRYMELSDVRTETEPTSPRL